MDKCAWCENPAFAHVHGLHLCIDHFLKLVQAVTARHSTITDTLYYLENERFMLKGPERRLPRSVLQQSSQLGGEFAWRPEDFIEAVEAGRQVPLAILGFEIQYRFSETMICELYWRSFSMEEKRGNEDWIAYCNRTADECIRKFNTLVIADIEKEALDYYHLYPIKNQGDNLNDYLRFCIEFVDTRPS